MHDKNNVCSKCGENINATAKFCPMCGFELIVSSAKKIRDSYKSKMTRGETISISPEKRIFSASKINQVFKKAKQVKNTIEKIKNKAQENKNSKQERTTKNSSTPPPIPRKPKTPPPISKNTAKGDKSGPPPLRK